MARIQLKRGPKAALPTSGMLAGEPLVTTDRGTLHIATDATTKLAVVPAMIYFVYLSIERVTCGMLLSKRLFTFLTIIYYIF